MKMTRLTLALILYSVFSVSTPFRPPWRPSVVFNAGGTDEALVNPGMGWVYYLLEPSLGLRLTHGWPATRSTGSRASPRSTCTRSLERSRTRRGRLPLGHLRFRGAYRGSTKAKIAIRVICCNQTENASPDWVRGRCEGHLVPVQEARRSRRFPARWEPVYDDPVFLGEVLDFLKAFAARTTWGSSVAFVDIGSFGMYGEGHTGDTSKLSKRRRTASRVFTSIFGGSTSRVPRDFGRRSRQGDPRPDADDEVHARERRGVPRRFDFLL